MYSVHPTQDILIKEENPPILAGQLICHSKVQVGRIAWLQLCLDIQYSNISYEVLRSRDILLEPVGRSDSGSTLDKIEEILNDILFDCSNID